MRPTPDTCWRQAMQHFAQSERCRALAAAADNAAERSQLLLLAEAHAADSDLMATEARLLELAEAAG
jgi:hypothetical protein